MIEDLASAKLVDNRKQPCASLAESANLAHWDATLDEFGLRDRATLLLDGEAANKPELMAFARDAEFLFNISGHFHQTDVMAAVPHRVYVDLDPAFTQIWAEVYHSAMNLEPHDIFMSIGGRLGRPDCRAPLAGRTWLPIGVPVALGHFTLPNLAEPGEVWTTFTHWYGYPRGRVRGPVVRQQERGVRQAHRPAEANARPARDRHRPQRRRPHQRARPRRRLAAGRCAAAQHALAALSRLRRAKPGRVLRREERLCPLALRLVQRPQRHVPCPRPPPSSSRTPAGPSSIPKARGCSPSPTRASALAALEKVERDPLRHAQAARRHRGELLRRPRRGEPLPRDREAVSDTRCGRAR